MDNEKLLHKLKESVIDLNQRVEALEKKSASTVMFDVSEFAQKLASALEELSGQASGTNQAPEANQDSAEIIST